MVSSIVVLLLSYNHGFIDMSFRLEWRNGQWQRSRVALKDPFNALLSILLRIFYDSKSEWLMKTVEKGMDTIQLAESDERTEVW